MTMMDGCAECAMKLREIDRLEKENRRLLEGIDALWGSLPIEVVRDFEQEAPELAIMAMDAHQRCWHGD